MDIVDKTQHKFWIHESHKHENLNMQSYLFTFNRLNVSLRSNCFSKYCLNVVQVEFVQ